MSILMNHVNPVKLTSGFRAFWIGARSTPRGVLILSRADVLFRSRSLQHLGPLAEFILRS